jgi:hypothetical protein
VLPYSIIWLSIVVRWVRCCASTTSARNNTIKIQITAQASIPSVDVKTKRQQFAAWVAALMPLPAKVCRL